MLNPVYSAASAALVAFIAVALPVSAQDGPAKTAAEIRDCSRANLPDESMAQNITLQPTDRAGKTKDIRAVFFLKRLDEEETRGTLQVRSPIDVSGVSYLWIDTGTDDRLFLYLPTVQRVRRITGKTAANSMLGSDFSYEDVKYLRGVTAGGEVEKLADTQTAERPVYALQVIPPPSDESAYKRLVFHIDKTTCVPLEIAFYEAGEMPRKQLAADPESLKQVGERWLATRLTMRDLSEDTHTTLEITEVQFDQRINGAVFNNRGFYLGAYLPKPRD